jgi:arylformamidase
MLVIDLTLPLNDQTPVYVDADGHRDPAYEATPWFSVSEQGYSVHRIEMGTHTGTHLDAPAHFHRNGRTVDQISPSELLGPAAVIDARSWDQVTAAALRRHHLLIDSDSMLLFLLPDSGISLTADAVGLVVDWHPRFVLYRGQFVDESGRYHHNRVWLGADIPLVTDLAPAAEEVRNGDLLMVAPLLLDAMDGAPCRVFALRSSPLL